MGRASRAQLQNRVPWSRLLAALCIGAPALAIGGVPPLVVPIFVLGVGLLGWRVSGRARADLHVPWAALLFLGLAGWCALQWAPLPGLRSLFAPAIDSRVDEALATAGVQPRAGLSVSPNDTALEVARLLGLAGLCLFAAQLSWRITAAVISATGASVTAAGLAHEVLGSAKIYGIYAAQQTDLGALPSMLGTFVNPNHQSGLLLLSLFATGALAADQLHGARTARDASQAEARRDRGIAACGLLLLLLPALLLSLSRGALVALVLLGPPALFLALRKLRTAQRTAPKRTLPMTLRFVAAAVLVALLVVFAQHGAWQQLATLWTDPAGAFSDKLGPPIAALHLIDLSPWLGTGRGTYIDLSALVPEASTSVLFTHIESAPISAVIEFGPIVGGAAVLASVVWWVSAFRSHDRRRDLRSRRILLLGMLAVGLQNIGDFSLEFLGVAAPMAALMGALSGSAGRTLRPKLGRRWAVVGALVGLAFALPAVSGTWSRRGAENRAIEGDDAALRGALRMRPLDGGLHAISARAALLSDDPSAHARATVATQLRPMAMAPWMQLSVAEKRLGHAAASDVAMRTALDLIRRPVADPLADDLIARYSPDALERVSPPDAWAWRMLVRAMLVRSPAHADALAKARTRSHPDDAEPVLIRSRVALLRDRPALALHHATLATHLAPEQAAVHVAEARALVRLEGVGAATAYLDTARQLDVDDPDVLDEVLAQLLSRSPEPADRVRARTLAEGLLMRSNTKAGAARLRALLRSLDAPRP